MLLRILLIIAVLLVVTTIMFKDHNLDICPSTGKPCQMKSHLRIFNH